MFFIYEDKRIKITAPVLTQNQTEQENITQTFDFLSSVFSQVSDRFEMVQNIIVRLSCRNICLMC